MSLTKTRPRAGEILGYKRNGVPIRLVAGAANPAFDSQNSIGQATRYDINATFSLTNSGNCILVAVNDNNIMANSATDVTDVTYGGVTIPFLAKASSNDSDAGGLIVFGLVSDSLPTGANNVVVSLGIDSFTEWVGAVSYAAVDSLGTPVIATGASDGSSTQFGVTVPSTTTDGIVVTFTSFGSEEAPSTVSPGVNRWTEIADSNSAAGNGWCIEQASAGGGASTTVNWTNSAADWWADIAIELLPSTGGGSDTGSGGVQLPKMSISGTSHEKSVVTASVKLPKMSVSGTSHEKSVATGGVKLPKMSVSGNSSDVVSAQGGIKIPKMSVFGTSHEKSVATGSVQIPKMHVQGSSGSKNCESLFAFSLF